MSANERAPATQWYWKDYLTDPGVRGMTFDQRGRYVEVLAVTHQTAEPGVMTEEQVRIWACYTREEWAEHRAAFTGVFKIQGDTWVQKRTVEERRKQKRRFEQSQRGGRTSATRTRDSLGRLAPLLDADVESDVEAGPGTPSSASASSSSMRRDPTPPFPARSSPGMSRDSVSDNGNGAESGNGMKHIGDVLAGLDLRAQGVDTRARDPLSDAFLARIQSQFTELDVYAIAAGLREEARSGGVRDLRGLLVHRCKALRAGSGHPSGRAAPSESKSAQAPPRGLAPSDAACPTPPSEGQPEES